MLFSMALDLQREGVGKFVSILYHAILDIPKKQNCLLLRAHSVAFEHIDTK